MQLPVSEYNLLVSECNLPVSDYQIRDTIPSFRIQLHLNMLDFPSLLVESQVFGETSPFWKFLQAKRHKEPPSQSHRTGKRRAALGARQGWWHPMRMWRLKRQRPPGGSCFPCASCACQPNQRWFFRGWASKRQSESLSIYLSVCLSVCLSQSLVPIRPISLNYCMLLRVPRKSEARSYEVPHLSRKITLANLKIWCSKMQPSQEISALTSRHVWLMCLLCRACHAKCIFADLFKRPTAAIDFFAFCSLVARCRIVQARIALWSFWHFGFEMCLAQQHRTPFEHLNLQKCSERRVLCTFWLLNALRTTFFEHLQCRTGCVPTILTSKYALHY